MRLFLLTTFLLATIGGAICAQTLSTVKHTRGATVTTCNDTTAITLAVGDVFSEVCDPGKSYESGFCVVQVIAQYVDGNGKHRTKVVWADTVFVSDGDTTVTYDAIDALTMPTGEVYNTYTQVVHQPYVGLMTNIHLFSNIGP